MVDAAAKAAGRFPVLGRAGGLAMSHAPAVCALSKDRAVDVLFNGETLAVQEDKPGALGEELGCNSAVRILDGKHKWGPFLLRELIGRAEIPWNNREVGTSENRIDLEVGTKLLTGLSGLIGRRTGERARDEEFRPAHNWAHVRLTTCSRDRNVQHRTNDGCGLFDE
ncbi:uncharacterized protein LAESUDRAFT_811754 [Laetiporus sulphureus 93-53]|uniref:Uncharacterized protein n=1 Tax=Laetiporus sulphureus 93-53 TaxID=1314785 RepID=A0A165EWA8_9APHY|nr:uncharacterized protein LAESUDRAFT_811754 [Laetiporus sulphureus 93-53]KZT07903.1 hypothetical protein LAESUDRAFT_811754 [Laetiporus sulphureus 93-53]